MKQRSVIPLILFLAFSTSFIANAEEIADLVLMNAKIITVDAENTIAQAVAIKDSLILKVGSNQDMQAHIDASSTEVKNMNGLTITPGMIDAHSHLLFYGTSVNEYVNLRGDDTRSVEDVVAKIAARVQEVQPDEWIMGDGFFLLERLPTREDLDPVSPDNPVMLQSLGGHYGSCNSKALEVAGVDKNTPDPIGGIIERDPSTGEPNGVLWNHPAMDVVRKFFPAPGVEAMTRDVIWAQEDYMDAGYTSFQDVNVRGISRVEAYIEAKDSLKIRGYILYTIETTHEANTSLENLNPTQDPWLSLMGDKFLVDGQPPTAYTHESHNGPSWDMPTWNPDTLKQVVKDLHKAGHQLAFHVMGDAAIDLVLEALEEALDETPRENHRHRLEHVFLPTKAAIQKMKELEVIAVLQPVALYTSGDFYIALFGTERVQRLNSVRSFLDAGVPVAFSTDYPTVILLHPKYNLWSSIARRTLGGTIISSEESITIQEALRLHTMGAAYAAFEEDKKGSIEEGKYADLTIWSDDMYTIPTDEIRNLYVRGVIVGGILYENTTVGIKNKSDDENPDHFNLYANYPNPFNSSTFISYSLVKQGQTTLKIYNSLGQVVRTLVNQTQLPGMYRISWDGFDNYRRKVPSGQYYFQLKQGDNLLVQKALLLK